jgi:thiol-disulfide isomerase/thioredoxin
MVQFAIVAQDDCYAKANNYRYASDDSIFDRIRRAQQMIINCQMPQDSFVNLKGLKKKITDYRGKPTFINFWYLHCPPCINEIPSLNELVKNYNDKINVVAISPDKKEDVIKFLSTHLFNAEIVADAQKFIDTYNLGSGFPFSILLDSAGKIIWVKSGGGETPETQMDLYKELNTIIDKYLHE